MVETLMEITWCEVVRPAAIGGTGRTSWINIARTSRPWLSAAAVTSPQFQRHADLAVRRCLWLRHAAGLAAAVLLGLRRRAVDVFPVAVGAVRHGRVFHGRSGWLPLEAPVTLKKPIVDWSCWAWLDSSSAVEAISSDAEAFCWMTWSSSWSALLIWPTPVLCSALAALISRTSSAVLRMSGTSLREHFAGAFGVATPFLDKLG